MSDDLIRRSLYSGFGMAHLVAEGAPIHPDELDWLCDCRQCRKRQKNQLKAYNDYWKKRGAKV